MSTPESVQSGLSRSWLNSKTLLWIILFFAFVVRVLSYTSGRALWIDEAMLSLNIIHASLPQLLFKPMLYYQVAPLGFLTVEKGLVTLLGSDELVLRLFPIICSLLGLGLFYRLSKQTQLGKLAFLVAVAGFAVSRGIVYYAGEVKQYASDVLVMLSLLLLAYRVFAQSQNRKTIVWLGLAGFIAIWFAYPAYFALLGLGLALLVLLYRQGDRKGMLGIGLCLLAWSVSIGIYFAVGLESIRASSAHQAIWRDVWDQQLAAFMPPLYTLKGWQWLFSRTIEVFKYPVGSQVQGLSALVFLVGIVRLVIQRKANNRAQLWLLAAPILTTLLASALHLYPYMGRLVLFLVPNYLLLMASGLDVIQERVKLPAVVLPILGLALIVPSLFCSKLYCVQSEEIKPVLSYIQAHKQADDVVLVYYGAQPALAYYASRYQLPPVLSGEYDAYVTGMDRRNRPEERHEFVTRLLNTAGQHYRRLWLLTTHLHGNEGREYIQQLNTSAHLLTSYRYKGGGTYLYQINSAH